ncbi:MAG: phosphatase PAP2 family protein [Candidatus Aminicenantes bacterium]|nr:phosphatase PAP2 family protein [Candidatus Aminicenantes bacterium]
MQLRKSAAVLLLVCFFSGQAVFSQVDESEEAEKAAFENTPGKKIINTYVSGFFRDEAEMWSAPFHLDWENLVIFSTVLVGAGLLVANDEGIYENFKLYQSRNPWVAKVSPAVTMLGDWGVDCGIAGLFFLGGLLLKDQKARDTGLMAWETLLHTGLLVQVVKHLAGRQRPQVENGLDYWYGPGAFFKRYSQGSFSHYDSFFSGHTVSAWGLATVIAENYKDHHWVPIACYSLATLAGLSRVTEDAHWLSDVFLGAVIGYAVGKMVVRNQKKRLHWAPSLSPGGAGLSFSYEIK